MSRPALIAWYRNAACIASRTAFMPRKAKETFEMPPLSLTSGKRAFSWRVASMNDTA